MRLSIRHRTTWRYECAADYAAQVLRLTPRPYDGLDVLHWSVRASGSGKLLSFEDGFGNLSHLHTVVDPHTELAIEVEGVVETSDTGGAVRGSLETLPPDVYLRQTDLTLPSDAIVAMASEAKPASSSVADLLRRLMDLVAERVAYRPGSTDVRTTAAEAMAGGSGVCQDQAHVFLSAARSLGIPARYVGGYLGLDGEGRIAQSMRGSDREEAGHAWAEAWDAQNGWTGFDPANRTLPGAWHVRTSIGLDYASASPARGIRRGRGGEALEVGVQVARLAGQ